MTQRLTLRNFVTIKKKCLCFQGEMCATPEIFAHLTHLLINLAEGKLCVVLEVRQNAVTLNC